MTDPFMGKFRSRAGYHWHVLQERTPTRQRVLSRMLTLPSHTLSLRLLVGEDTLMAYFVEFCPGCSGDVGDPGYNLGSYLVCDDEACSRYNTPFAGLAPVSAVSLDGGNASAQIILSRLETQVSQAYSTAQGDPLGYMLAWYELAEELEREFLLAMDVANKLADESEEK